MSYTLFHPVFQTKGGTVPKHATMNTRLPDVGGSDGTFTLHRWWNTWNIWEHFFSFPSNSQISGVARITESVPEWKWNKFSHFRKALFFSQYRRERERTEGVGCNAIAAMAFRPSPFMVFWALLKVLYFHPFPALRNGGGFLSH